LADNARLTMLHVIPASLPARARRRAERNARQLLEAEAKELAPRLPVRVAFRCVVKAGTAAAEIARCGASVKAELIVMGRCGLRALRDVFLGSTAERVIRRGKLPVLAVRLRPRTPYRRPAIALDTDQAAHSSLALLLRVFPPPRPLVTVIHAFDGPYQGLAYLNLALEDAVEYQDEYRQEALQDIDQLLTSSLVRLKIAPGDAPLWRKHVRYGSPRAVIEKAVQQGDNDLLVLGTRGHSGVAHAFLGTLAGDVLRKVACDVLVVPPRRDAPTTT
jgi:nucleotide-binding universal stress UspA family protein